MNWAQVHKLKPGDRLEWIEGIACIDEDGGSGNGWIFSGAIAEFMGTEIVDGDDHEWLGVQEHQRKVMVVRLVTSLPSRAVNLPPMRHRGTPDWCYDESWFCLPKSVRPVRQGESQCG